MEQAPLRSPSSTAVPNAMSASLSWYDTVFIPSSTITSVRPGARSISSTSPLMGTTVTFSGASMWYQTQRLPRFCATTTSELGTHCTYEENERRVERVWLAISYKCSARRLSRKSNCEATTAPRVRDDPRRPRSRRLFEALRGAPWSLGHSFPSNRPSPRASPSPQ